MNGEKENPNWKPCPVCQGTPSLRVYQHVTDVETVLGQTVYMVCTKNPEHQIAMSGLDDFFPIKEKAGLAIQMWNGELSFEESWEIYKKRLQKRPAARSSLQPDKAAVMCGGPKDGKQIALSSVVYSIGFEEIQKSNTPELPWLVIVHVYEKDLSESGKVLQFKHRGTGRRPTNVELPFWINGHNLEHGISLNLAYDILYDRWYEIPVVDRIIKENYCRVSYRVSGGK